MSLSSNAPDDTEFVSLLTSHQPALRSFLRILIPNAEDIQDVLQNTNIALWERRGQFETGTNFQAWAFAIARFRALEFRRAKKKDQYLVFSEELIELFADEPFERSPDHIERRKQALRSCLTALKPKDRSLINARYATQTKLDDFARSDGRSSASLRVILNRLRSALRRCIDQNMATTSES